MCYFVLFRPVLSCLLLICPVGCYALLVVGAGAGVIKRASGGEGRWITRYSIAQIFFLKLSHFFSKFLKPSQSFSTFVFHFSIDRCDAAFVRLQRKIDTFQY